MNAIKKLVVVAAAVAGGLTAAGTGWAYWSAQGSGTATATVGTWKTNTTTAVVSSGNPSLVGQQVTYTATVTPAKPGTPTGKIAFFDGASAISSCGGTTGVALSGASATCTQTYAAAGSHSITAQYLGDASFNPSPVSGTFTQVVNQASTSTSLSVAGSPAFYGSENTVVFTAGSSSSSGTPTGTVAIKQGATTLCSITVPGASTCSPGAIALGASPTAYTITAVYSGDANFSGSSSPAQSLTIDKAKATITWPTPTAITYGTALSVTQLSATANIPGTFTYNPAAGTVLNAISQSLTLMFNPTDTTNYEATPAGVTLAVNKAPLTITASSASMTYGGTVPAITASFAGFVNGENVAVLTTAPTCSTTATNNSGAGSAQASSCSGAAAANYSLGYVAGTVTVNKAPLTITASSASMTFGGSVPTITAGYAGFVNGQNSSVLTAQPTCGTTATPTSTVAGSPYSSTCSGAAAANYSFTYSPGTVTVNKAILTVTANNASKGQGLANPSFTASYSGFVNGNTQSVLSGAPSLTTTATTSSPVGTYTITAAQGTLAAANYTFTFVDGSLTVNPIPTITSPTNGSPRVVTIKTNANVTITGTGFQNGATVSLTGNGGFDLKSTTVNSASQITINVDAPSASGKFNNIVVTNPDGGSVTCTNCLKSN